MNSRTATRNGQFDNGISPEDGQWNGVDRKGVSELKAEATAAVDYVGAGKAGKKMADKEAKSKGQLKLFKNRKNNSLNVKNKAQS